MSHSRLTDHLSLDKTHRRETHIYFYHVDCTRISLNLDDADWKGIIIRTFQPIDWGHNHFFYLNLNIDLKVWCFDRLKRCNKSFQTVLSLSLSHSILLISFSFMQIRKKMLTVATMPIKAHFFYFSFFWIYFPETIKMFKWLKYRGCHLALTYMWMRWKHCACVHLFV